MGSATQHERLSQLHTLSFNCSVILCRFRRSTSKVSYDRICHECHFTATKTRKMPWPRNVFKTSRSHSSTVRIFRVLNRQNIIGIVFPVLKSTKPSHEGSARQTFTLARYMLQTSCSAFVLRCFMLIHSFPMYIFHNGSVDLF